MNWLTKVLEEGNTGIPSTKRVISMLFAIIAASMFIYLEVHPKVISEVSKENIFNAVLVFIATMAGITTFGALTKSNNNGETK